MINKDFFLAVDLLQKEKGIDKELFLEALESGLTSALKKEEGEAKHAFVKLDAERKTIRVYSYKIIVEQVEDPDKEISLSDARKTKKSFKLGEKVMEEIAPKNLGRIAIQTARQVVMQKLREIERKNTLTELDGKEGEVISAVVKRSDGLNVFVDIGFGQTEGVLSVNDQIPGEQYQLGERIRVYVRRVKDDFRGTQLQVSRTNIQFVRKLFELEIPEIQSGVIEVKAIAREAGYRTKIAVFSTDSNIDVVGACIGNKGMRINSIIEELRGEKIDIIPFSENPYEFIAAALSPSPVLNIEILEEEKRSKVLVPANKLSLAIGRAGQNVRLAARLTGYKIDVKGEDELKTDSETFGEVETDNIVDDLAAQKIETDLSDADIFGDL